MQEIFPAAIEHIRLMKARITQQEAAIQRLQRTGQDISAALARLRLLHAALEEVVSSWRAWHRLKSRLPRPYGHCV